MKIHYKDYFYLFLGIIGAFITLFGLSQEPLQIYYVIGSSMLLITAIYYNVFYFIALEIILIAGHGTILLGIGSILQVILPLFLCVQLLFYYCLSGRLTSIFLLIGILGIACISVGFAYKNQWIFFFGSAGIAAYAFYYAKTNKVSLLWAILNTLFALIALYKILLLGNLYG